MQRFQRFLPCFLASVLMACAQVLRAPDTPAAPTEGPPAGLTETAAQQPPDPCAEAVDWLDRAMCRHPQAIYFGFLIATLGGIALAAALKRPSSAHCRTEPGLNLQNPSEPGTPVTVCN